MDNLKSLNLGEGVEATDQNCHADTYDTCEDANFNYFNEEVFDRYGDSCYLYTFNPDHCGEFDTEEFNSLKMCCACEEDGM